MVQEISEAVYCTVRGQRLRAVYQTVEGISEGISGTAEGSPMH